ncbi:MAG: hypothetical protein EPO24_15940 [Bacteroidetes bacterium]|nr:MAG: hypothetical protein EPO24_15940 [Bacteroidota bacterium]
MKIKTKASNALNVVREWQSEMFPSERCRLLEAEHRRLIEEKILDDQRNTSEKAVLSAIEELCAAKTAKELPAIIARQPFPIQVFLFERFHYFQSALEELGERELVYPAPLGLFLREGLVEMWNLRKQRGWFDERL